MSDLIDRQAAIDAIGRDPMGGLNYERILKYLPTAEPKTGRWIADGQKQKHGNEWMHCSVCGFSDIDVPATHTNYCPNCGAKMEGEADG